MKYVNKQIQIERNCSPLMEEFYTLYFGEFAKKPQDYATRYEQGESQDEGQASCKCRQCGSRQLLDDVG